MKKILVLLALSFCSVTFAQSKKEINVQLKSDLQRKQIYYDSIHVLHSTQVGAFPSYYSNYRKLMDGVRDKRREAQVLAEEIVLNYRKVMALEIQLPKDLVLEDVKRYNLPNYHMSDEDLKALEAEFEVRGEITPMDFKGKKIKEQNEEIPTKISIYESASRRMRGELSVIQGFQTTIKNLDTLNLWYDNLLKQYNAKNDVLKAELKKAEENYKAKGPKGFIPSYDQVFPDAFRKTETEIQEPDLSEGEWFVPSDERDAIPPPPPPVIYDVVAEPAQFSGGTIALKEYLVKNMKMPDVAMENGINGKCHLKFIVSESGNISNVKVIKGIPDCKECDEEAVRLVKAMPDWIPAKNEGKVVNSFYSLPITFSNQ